MTSTDFFEGVMWGFVFGLPFVAMTSFWARLLLGAGLNLVIYRAVLDGVAHAGFRWSNILAAQILLGAFCAALVKPLLHFVVTRIRSAKWR
jgi:hypothetical protein